MLKARSPKGYGEQGKTTGNSPVRGRDWKRRKRQTLGEEDGKWWWGRGRKGQKAASLIGGCKLYSVIEALIGVAG